MDYTIISVSDRAIENIANNKKILDEKNFNFHQLVFFNGNSEDSDPFEELKSMGYNTSSWSPVDGRKSPMLKTEAATWISNIRIYEYIVKNKIKNFLILEDDILLHPDFVERLDLFVKELPKDYDFLSLFYMKAHNKKSKEVDLGLQYIQKSDNQKAGYQATLFSYVGAKKMLRLLQKRGLVYTNDCTLFFFAQNKMLNGYSKTRNSPRMLSHDISLKSEIDPENYRKLNLKDDIV